MSQPARVGSLPTDRTYFTIDEAAELLVLSRLTIRRMISRGELPARRFGNSIRILAADLEAAGKPVGTAR